VRFEWHPFFLLSSKNEFLAAFISTCGADTFQEQEAIKRRFMKRGHPRLDRKDSGVTTSYFCEVVLVFGAHYSRRIVSSTDAS
jgi:hypothetical protein